MPVAPATSTLAPHNYLPYRRPATATSPAIFSLRKLASSAAVAVGATLRSRRHPETLGASDLALFGSRAASSIPMASPERHAIGREASAAEDRAREGGDGVVAVANVVGESGRDVGARPPPPPTTDGDSKRHSNSAGSSISGARKLPHPPRPDAPLLSVAPMMDWTDVHYRSLARMISKKTWLYTEMVVDTTLIHNPDVGRFLEFPEFQRPIVCQLGGSDPEKLALAARVAARYGYDEINLNCGCPSDRVAGAGCFGASLMKEPERVAEAALRMREAVEDVERSGEVGSAMREAHAAGGGRDGGSDASSSLSSNSFVPPKPIDVTVKCRLGVDDLDSYEALCRFVRTVSERGKVSHFVVHARKCHLDGLSPAQNRSVPPLRHGWVWALKRDFPHLRFTLNGGLESTAAARDALARDLESVRRESEGEGGSAVADGRGATATSPSPPSPPLLEGTMIGRAAYHSPWSVLSGADVELWGADENAARSRREVLERYADYCDAACASADAAAAREGHGSYGTRKRPSGRVLTAPLLGLFHGEPGGKRWRNELDQALKKFGATRSGGGSKKKKQKKGGGEESNGGADVDEGGEEHQGPCRMREVIAQASRAIPDHVLDAPPPRGKQIDDVARAAAKAAEIAFAAASAHAAKKKRGPLPAPLRPLMSLPEPVSSVDDVEEEKEKEKASDVAAAAAAVPAAAAAGNEE